MKEKKIAEAHQKILEELEREQTVGRNLVSQLEKAVSRYLKKEGFRAVDVADLIEKLASFYHRHIQKEDKEFFIPVMDYFDESSQEKLLQAAMAFDQTMLQDLQEEMLEKLEGEKAPEAPPVEIQGPVETYACLFCGYTYDPRKGDSVGKVKPGTLFKDLPEHWQCPKCHVSKNSFLKNPI